SFVRRWPSQRPCGQRSLVAASSTSRPSHESESPNTDSGRILHVMRWLRWLQQPQKILNLPNRWRELEEQVRQLESMQNHLRREIDRSRSWIEVPEKLMAE